MRVCSGMVAVAVAGETEVREVKRKSVRGRKSADRRKAGAACSAMHKYINMVLARRTPSDRKAQDLRTQGEKVIRLVTQASSAESITPYFHSLVCAIPRQVVCVEYCLEPV